MLARPAELDALQNAARERGVEVAVFTAGEGPNPLPAAQLNHAAGGLGRTDQREPIGDALNECGDDGSPPTAFGPASGEPPRTGKTQHRTLQQAIAGR